MEAPETVRWPELTECDPNILWQIWGTGIRGLMSSMANLPQGNQEILVVRDKVGRPPGELGVSNSMECDIFPSVLWHCWLGDRKDIRPVKKLGVGLLVVMILPELWTTYSSSCHHHLHLPLLQWFTWKKAVKTERDLSRWTRKHALSHITCSWLCQRQNV